MDDWKLQPADDLGLAGSERARSLKRESGLLASAGHRVWWTLMRGYLRTYHRMKIVNAERLPKAPPFVIVANHSSHLDAMVLAAPIPHEIRDRVFPIAAGDVFFENPLVAIFSAGMLNALPIWRKKAGAKAMQELRRRLVEEPCGYILFPEGTRSRDGTMGLFRAGLGMMLAGTDVPVVPCYLRGAFAAMPPGAKIPRPRKLTLFIGEALRFASAPDSREGWEEVSQTCETAVRKLAGDDHANQSVKAPVE